MTNQKDSQETAVRRPSRKNVWRPPVRKPHTSEIAAYMRNILPPRDEYMNAQIAERTDQPQLAMSLFHTAPATDAPSNANTPAQEQENDLQRGKATLPAAVTIHADGACIGNPGPGGFAAIIQTPGQQDLVVTGGDHHTTNNRMELSAVIEAICAVKQYPHLQRAELAIHTDSQYVSNAFNQNWIESWLANGWRNSRGDQVKNQDLWTKLLNETQGLNIAWHWVKGHSGDPMNERCDRLAVACSQQAASRRRYWVTAVNPAENAQKPSRMEQARSLNRHVREDVEHALASIEKGQSDYARQSMEHALDTLAQQAEALAKLERVALQGTRVW